MIKKIISNNIDFNNHYLILAFICDKCNYNCIYCYNKKPRSFINLDLLKFYNFLCKLKEHLNKTINLELIGGEPTLHSDLYDFCKKCKDNGITVTIYTNFSQNESFYKKLLNLNVKLYISWHGENQLFIHKLNKFKQYKNNIYVSVMYEHSAIKKSISIFDQISCFKKCLTLIDAKLTDYSNEEIKAYESKIYDDEKTYTIINEKNIRQVSEEFLVNNKFNQFKHWRCDALKNGLYVHYNGNAYPCQNYMSNFKKPIFNIYNLDTVNNIKLHYVICPFDYCECGFSFNKSKND